MLNFTKHFSSSSQVRLFADDCLLYSIFSYIEGQLKLQADLKSLDNSTSTSGMSFNPSKCTIMFISRTTSFFIFYSLCGVILQQVEEAKYLGVLLSSDLMWSKHTQHLVSKANSMMGLLHRNLTTSSIKPYEQAFIPPVHSRLEYCCAIWDPHLAKDRGDLDTVQWRAACFVAQDYYRDISITVAKEPTVATAQRPKTRHQPTSHVYDCDGQGGCASGRYSPRCRFQHTQQVRAQI